MVAMSLRPAWITVRPCLKKTRWLCQGLQSPGGNSRSPRGVPLETLLVQPMPGKFLGTVCFPVAVIDRYWAFRPPSTLPQDPWGTHLC